MALRAPRQRTDWGALVVTSSLAASIATVGSFATDRLKGNDEAMRHHCEIARDVLLKVEPSPYIGQRTRLAITREAAMVVHQCMREGS
ncbi:hypothetical protein [Sphingomonas bacterium]|uniref:hypothetical protein n=1 Tax=Sphingomonas bacterium TaxID=1895847 RepID=UPI001575DA48|nr:hypothetical protein [Sphingomonas bacterium]